MQVNMILRSCSSQMRSLTCGSKIYFRDHRARKILSVPPTIHPEEGSQPKERTLIASASGVVLGVEDDLSRWILSLRPPKSGETQWLEDMIEDKRDRNFVGETVEDFDSGETLHR
jgi:hypothetical protein